jgi:hypothetical protein
MKDRVRASTWPLAVAVLLSSEFVYSAEVQDIYARCEPQLGSRYDTLSPVDRAAKQDRYFSCVAVEIYGRLQVSLRHSLMELNRWKGRNTSKVKSAVRISRQEARSEIDAMHDEERSALNTSRENRARQISSVDERNAMNAQFHTDLREMNIRHSADVGVLAEVCVECVRGANVQLARMWEADYRNLIGQYQTKSASVRSLVSQIRDTPSDSSVNSYLASGSQVPRAVVETLPPPDGTCRWYCEPPRPPSSKDAISLRQNVTDETMVPVSNARAAITNADAPPPATPEEPMGPPIPEVIGQATYEDGTVSPVRMGDNVEGPCQINFIDDTSIDIPANDQRRVDEYVYDPATASGDTNFSYLRGLFVFTSGLLAGEDEVDNVVLEPVQMGSAGIRG